ncbi:lysophospholipid acyltransferase family protein [Halodesulfovibrio marinisediminis]|uniref:1-acyl-sn-glycerol-3-phosphate acyltransferase n=1 Tax=Halodesulfovibrio marinisediminis DSM 17456 TaxID=1121457 RepID=A0A1N6HH32_9BACT|nr:lysophospholipid acyltransferase family protein [Halodesulfovibrio marinisediminis]SIO19168.1 1-acyl-sn-glycerol-3-phosphate acyltransferase [Halodesulfovibrio marinisediminis DSM 17456]
MIRTIWFYFSFLLTTLYVCIFMPIAAAIDNSGKMVRYFAMLWCKAARDCSQIKLITDTDNIPTDQPVIFVANHQSQFDIPLSTVALQKAMPAFMAKKNLQNLPLIGRCFRLFGNISVDRTNRRAAMQSLEAAATTIRNGRSVILFPEGTRQEQFEELGDFKTGAIMLALKAGVPIVPVIIEGTGDILPKGRIALGTRKKVYITAMEPISTAEYTVKQRNEFSDMLRERMNKKYMEMRACHKKEA